MALYIMELDSVEATRWIPEGVPADGFLEIPPDGPDGPDGARDIPPPIEAEVELRVPLSRRAPIGDLAKLPMDAKLVKDDAMPSAPLLSHDGIRPMSSLWPDAEAARDEDREEVMVITEARRPRLFLLCLSDASEAYDCHATKFQRYHIL
jgi:hypothetical protein